MMRHATLALALLAALAAPAQAVAIYGGPASATGNGYVTTGTQTFAGDKTFSGTTTLGTTNITAFTMAANTIFTRTAGSSAAEAMVRFKVSDSSSYIEFGNNVTTNSNFAGYMIGVADGTNPGIAIYGQSVTDTGTNGLIDMHARIGASTAPSTRPLLTLAAHNTNKFIINPDGAINVAATGAKIFAGSGSPESVYTAPVGSLYLRTDGGAGTSIYIKESGTGNTGWVAK